ncbi:UNVERIFIED_CONTAM: Snakin-1 [Sesamum radiatum]|uniref:Snakin-1 n=1 Tax=Sesamum radiatum TaxID=300843 RepID=A0AAW2M396_SESRA
MKVQFALAALLLVTLVLSSSFTDTTMALSSYCEEKCGVRCSKAGVKDRCLKYCGICCEECKCVPSGTYGNKHECPCYRDKINSKGKPKCP